jgi:antitoxin MazE
MDVQITKWGNSLGLRLPRSLASQAGVTEGQRVSIVADGDRLIIQAAARRYRIEDLVADMSPSAAHEAFDWGDDVGREIIDA